MNRGPVLRSLRGDRAFQRLRKGRQGGSKHLNLRLRPARHGEVRVAFVVSRKVGKAVVRNRVRRRLRESMRLMLLDGGHAWPESFDALVIVRPSAATVGYQELADGLRLALDRASQAAASGQAAAKPRREARP